MAYDLACSSNGLRIAPSQGADVEFESHTGDLFQLEHLCTLSLFSPHGEISPVRQAVKPPALHAGDTGSTPVPGTLLTK